MKEDIKDDEETNGCSSTKVKRYYPIKSQEAILSRDTTTPLGDGVFLTHLDTISEASFNESSYNESAESAEKAESQISAGSPIAKTTKYRKPLQPTAANIEEYMKKKIKQFEEVRFFSY